MKFKEDAQIRYSDGAPSAFERLLVNIIVQFLIAKYGMDHGSLLRILHLVSFIFQWIQSICKSLNVSCPFIKGLRKLS